MGTKRGQKHKSPIMKPNEIPKWKLICYLKEATRRIFLTAVRLYEPKRAKKSKKGPLNVQKHKIAHYEAQLHFKVSKIHSWVVKLVFYLHKSYRSIFLTAVTLGAIQRPKRAKIGLKEGPKYKIVYIVKRNMISKCSKFIVGM